MNRKYLEDKIKDALVLASGNSAKAQHLIIQWAAEDKQLLQLLTKPHLKGITAHAVGRVITQMDRDDEPLPEEVFWALWVGRMLHILDTSVLRRAKRKNKLHSNILTQYIFWRRKTRQSRMMNKIALTI